ncbi:MAG: hypothetical protein VKI81_10235 [Synechococcaceae cyanobacterium]|nr:hypothetical protein [Synechococcaceae cyanobacterium]
MLDTKSCIHVITGRLPSVRERFLRWWLRPDRHRLSEYGEQVGVEAAEVLAGDREVPGLPMERAEIWAG